MSRLTITLDDTLYRALKQAAAKRGRTIGSIIEESLVFYGIKSEHDARALVRRARARSTLTDAQATTLANAETRTVRKA